MIPNVCFSHIPRNAISSLRGELKVCSRDNFLAFASQAFASLAIRISFHLAATSQAMQATKAMVICQRTDTAAERFSHKKVYH